MHRSFEAAAKKVGIEYFLLFAWFLIQGLSFIAMLIIYGESVIAVQILYFLNLLHKHQGSLSLRRVEFIYGNQNVFTLISDSLSD